MKRLLLLVVVGACLLLSSCAKAVNPFIPVPIPCPQVAIKPMAPLPIRLLNENSKDSDVIRAYVESHVIQGNYISYLKSVKR